MVFSIGTAGLAARSSIQKSRVNVIPKPREANARSHQRVSRGEESAPLVSAFTTKGESHAAILCCISIVAQQAAEQIPPGCRRAPQHATTKSRVQGPGSGPAVKTAS